MANRREIAPTEEQIGRRAYEIYLERDGKQGQDVVDWIMAEQQLTAIFKLAAEHTGIQEDAPAPEQELLIDALESEPN